MMTPTHKWLAVTLALTMTLTPLAASASSTTSYRDLGQADSWAQDAIQTALSLGLMSGDGDGQFRPLAAITRQEAAAVLVRTLNLPTPATETSSFQDVSVSDWSHASIEAAVKAGLMNGDGNRTFRPQDEITREEMAVLLVKASGNQAAAGDNLSVADRDSISPWAKGYVQTALEKGLLHGDGTNFNPHAHASRQEVAMMAVTLAKQLADTQSPSATLDKITDSSVVLDGKSYRVAKSLQGLLSLANQNALAGAKLRFQADGDTVTKLTSLELNAAGVAAASGKAEFSGNVVLDGQNALLDGNLVVNSDYVSVQNLTVQGDLRLNPTVQNDFYAKKLHVQGKTLIAGGDANTVEFEDASLGSVTVSKDGVHVDSKGTTSMSDVEVSANASITGTGKIPKLSVASTVTNLQLDQPVQTLEVEGASTKLTLGTHTKIDSLILPKGAKISDIVSNYESVKNNITNILEKQADGTTAPFQQTPPVVTGGGGGYIPVPTPTPTPTPAEVPAVQSVRSIDTTTVEITFTKPLTSAVDVSFTNGLKVYFVHGPDSNNVIGLSTIKVVTAPQTTNAYEVLLSGQHTGKTFTGTAVQLKSRVTYSNGDPAVGKRVLLFDLQAKTQRTEVSYTDQNGEYALSGLVAGHMYILRTDIDPEDQEVPPAEIDLIYQAGAPLPELRYTAAEAVGRLTYPNGTPVKNRQLTFESPANQLVLGGITDTNGYFRVANLVPDETYKISVRSQSDPNSPYVEPFPFTWTYAPSRGTQGPVKIPEVKMVLPNLTGTLTDATGAGLTSGCLILRYQGVGYQPPVNKYSPMDFSGNYRIYLPDGSYTLELHDQSHSNGDPQPVNINVSNGEVTTSKQLDFAASALQLTGKIVDANGDRIPYAQLHLVKNGQTVYQGISREDGTYGIGGNWPDGTYTLTVLDNTSDIVNTSQLTLKTGEILTHDIPLFVQKPTVTAKTGWTNLRRGEPLLAQSSMPGFLYLVSSDVTVTDAVSLQQAVENGQAYLHSEVMPDHVYNFDTSHVTPGFYRLYAMNNGHISEPSTEVFAIDDSTPVQTLLDTSIGQLKIDDSADEPVQGIEFIPSGTTAGQLLAAVQTVPGVTAKITDFGGNAVADETPINANMQLQTNSDGDFKTYSLELAPEVSPYYVQAVDSSVGEPMYSKYGNIESLSIQAGTTVQQLIGAVTLADGVTARIVSVAGGTRQPVTDTTTVIDPATMKLEVNNMGERVLTDLVTSSGVIDKSIAGTNIGNLDLDGQGRVAGIKNIPFGTTVDAIKTAIHTATPNVGVQVLDRSMGSEITDRSKPLNEHMRLALIASDNTVKEYTLSLADSEASLIVLAPFRHAGTTASDTDGVVTGIVNVPQHTKATLLKLAAIVPDGSRVDILEGPGGQPVLDPDHTDVTSGMVLRVTSRLGVTKEYTITLSDK
ncbi:S-layer homology domain-containing protein [Tumebacillus flagellatus]|nr:S-layer homology domain-containing protein [Tumebacillus flagellatus]